MNLEDLKKASKKTNDCIIAARELYGELMTLLRYLQRAKGWSMANLLGGSFFKFNRNEALRQVNSSANQIKRLNRSYQTALGKLSVFDAENPSIGISKVVLDMVVGNTITEWIVHTDIVRTIKKNRWCLSALENQIEKLEKQEVFFDEKISAMLGGGRIS